MSEFMLFPFDKVEKDSDIIIYGAGEMAISFKEQIEAVNYCKIVCFFDRDSAEIKKIDKYECISPSEYINYKFDYILVGSDRHKNEINETLIKLGVEKDKIILVDDRYYLKNINKKLTPETANWNIYYKKAEEGALYQYEKIIEPFIKKFSLFDNNSIVLDFACGKGRIAEFIRNKCRSLICCDISKEAIDSCKERFKKFENVKYIVGKENKIDLESSSIDFIYSWDAMVHFSYKNIDRYLCEFFRIVKPGGYVFIHHSNLLNEDSIKEKSELWFENIHCRSNIGKEDVQFLAIKHGFEVKCQEIIGWGEARDLDCITILTKK